MSDFDFAEVLTRMVEVRASDVHLTPGFPPAIRVRGRITPMDDYPALTPQLTREVVYSILNNDQRKRFENLDQPPQSSPLLTGLGLVGLGLLLRQWQPRVLNLPQSRGEPDDSGLPRAARKSRDGVMTVLPGNLTGSVGRSLVFMGAGLMLVRALDMLVDDDDALF